MKHTRRHEPESPELLWVAKGSFLAVRATAVHASPQFRRLGLLAASAAVEDGVVWRYTVDLQISDSKAIAKEI